MTCRWCRSRPLAIVYHLILCRSAKIVGPHPQYSASEASVWDHHVPRDGCSPKPVASALYALIPDSNRSAVNQVGYELIYKEYPYLARLPNCSGKTEHDTGFIDWRPMKPIELPPIIMRRRGADRRRRRVRWAQPRS